jgi:predicted lysophospholipase L1 biosynthesis ABC-type transport system permease subunit
MNSPSLARLNEWGSAVPWPCEATSWFLLINEVANFFLARRGMPYVDYFSFPWWLCLGAVAFSILVSSAARICPTLRAAHVDPVVALRHDSTYSMRCKKLRT